MTNSNDKKTEIISHGVESLIEQLKNKGVEAGRIEAENIIKEAQEQADKIINDARIEVNIMMKNGYEKIQQEKQAAIDTLELAARNMRLELRQQIIKRLQEEVKRLVHKELENESFIRQLILLLTVNTADQLQQFKDSEIEIQLPEKALDFDKIRNDPRLLENDPLKKLAQGAASEVLRSGMNLKVNTNKQEVGIKVRIVEEDIELDLTEEAITEILIKHLQPRFRALLEGLLQ